LSHIQRASVDIAKLHLESTIVDNTAQQSILALVGFDADVTQLMRTSRTPSHSDITEEHGGGKKSFKEYSAGMTKG
jgi:hypothetical protein